MNRRAMITSFVTLIVIAAGTTLQAQTVKVTPLGSRTGEFCSGDRALLFEDPTGVRLLYDPGNTVAGGTDPRLGDVHGILLSHAHGDHFGTSKLSSDPAVGAPGCAGSTTTTAANSNLAEIAAAKNAAILAGGNLASFAGSKVAAVLQANVGGCPTIGLTNEMTFPRTSPCTGGVGIGAKRTLRLASATRGVQVAAVPADHPNEPPASLLSDPERTNLTANSINAYVGLATGFVVTFSNGLKVYLSGDSGLSSEMSSLIRGFYGVNLAVLNVGDVFTIGPEEGAFAVTELIRPNAVIPSHVNETATVGGIVQAGTKTARFIDMVSARGAQPYDDVRSLFTARRRVSVFVPLSGVTIEFDGDARCVSGCQGQ
jgi:L-ascorbate metabolism protein UlaG (beta-lactamase superfamily)